MRRIASKLISITTAAAVAWSCANFRATPAAARSLTPAENAALAEINNFLTDYYTVRDFSPGPLTSAEKNSIDEILNYARNKMLSLDDADAWNAADANPDAPVITPRPPDSGDDEPETFDLFSEALEKYRKEREAHYRVTITQTPESHWSYKDEDGDGNDDDPDVAGRITSYEQELIDAEVEAQRRELQKAADDKIGEYIDDAKPGEPDKNGAKEIKEKLDDALSKLGDVPVVGDALSDPLGYIMEKVWDKLKDLAFDKLPISTVLGALADVLKDRLVYYIWDEEYSEGFPKVEMAVLLGAGIALCVAAAIGYGIVKAAGKTKPFIGESVALGIILAEDIAIAITRNVTKGRMEDWEKEVKANYDKDHESLGAFTYRGALPGMLSAQLRLSVPGGASFVMDAAKRAAAFDELHPGYALPSDGYIAGYKKIVKNWRNYAISHNETSKSAETEISSARAVADGIKSASRSAEGYTQQLQARNLARIVSLQQTLNLRLDVARQTDFRARAALDRQQKREYLHAAFGAAARGWTPSAGSAY